MQKITPFLWFDGNIFDAAAFYTSVFPHSEVTEISAQSATLQLGEQTLIIFNGGPHYKLSPAISMFVNCETQQEIDDLWGKLTADGGEDSRCGWLKDKYGLSWQLVPPILGQYFQDKDSAAVKRVTDAMMKMNKLEIAALQKAFLGE